VVYVFNQWLAISLGTCSETQSNGSHCFDMATQMNALGSVFLVSPLYRSTNKPMASPTDTQIATCHCGYVRVHVRQSPRSIVKCNCWICRRYGALWAYYKPTSVKIEAPKNDLSKYSWNKKIRDYYRRKRCGCVTHYTYRGEQRETSMAVNAANFPPSVIGNARLRHLGDAESWKMLD
jgi:hypothetical protein